MSLEVKTDRTAYCPGETITIDATMTNNSSTAAKPYVKLLQTRKFFTYESHPVGKFGSFGHGPGRHGTFGHGRGKHGRGRHGAFGHGHRRHGMFGHGSQTDSKTTTHQFKLQMVGDDIESATRQLEPGGDSIVWKGKQFIIPNMLPNLDCGNISVTNTLEIGLDIPWALDLKLQMQVMIGTIPFNSHNAISTQPIGNVGNNQVAPMPEDTSGSGGAPNPEFLNSIMGEEKEELADDEGGDGDDGN